MTCGRAVAWPEGPRRRGVLVEEGSRGAEVEGGCPGNSFITDRFCWKEASKAAWEMAPDIGDIGPSEPGKWNIFQYCETKLIIYKTYHV